ncbi:protein of unknown function [Methylocaldum szegediense]|uniref:Uncharacterized protein n=1 Tax=Methylocaldum szegediense TaxID=73780 RepID=A0ABM9I1X4_9GAMM|nr:protein of unknown function [Methylocaldum szegediense]
MAWRGSGRVRHAERVGLVQRPIQSVQDFFRNVMRIPFLNLNSSYTSSVDALLPLERGRDNLRPQRNAHPNVSQSSRSSS